MFTFNDMIKECERELRQRKNVYPRLINQGKLSRKKANEQYQILEQIKNYLKSEHFKYA